MKNSFTYNIYCSVLSNPRQWMLIVLFNALGIFCVMNSADEIKKTRVEIESLQATFQAQWLNQGAKSPHAAAHFGIWVLKPTTALHFLEPGYTQFTGSAVWLEAHKQNLTKYVPVTDKVFLDRLIRLDVASMMQIFIPLYILLLSFSLFSSEKERETLPLILGMGISKWTYFRQKYFAQAGFIFLSLIPFWAVLILQYSGIARSIGTDSALFIRTLSIFGIQLIYFLLFLLIISAFSLYWRQSSIVLLVSFVWWAGSILIIPKISSQIAGLAYPLPSQEAFLNEVAKDLENGMDGHSPSDQRRKELEKATLAKYNVSSMDSLPVNFAGIALQASEEYGYQVFEKHFGKLDQLLYKQDRLNMLIGCVSPYIPMKDLVALAAGTDAVHHNVFSLQAEGKRREMNELLNQYMTNTKIEEGVAIETSDAIYAALKPFKFDLPDLGKMIGFRWPALIIFLFQGILAMWFIRKALNKHISYE